MSTNLDHGSLEVANFLAAISMGYLNKPENSTNLQNQSMIHETHPFFFPTNQSAAFALAAASSPFHQQFQQHFTQQFQNHISQLRHDTTVPQLDKPASASEGSKPMNGNQSKHEMPKVKILDESELPKDDSKCHACGDKSTGSHFGGISCESCKAFFRRSVQKNRWEEYKCSHESNCKMNTVTRKICQYCRYSTCLSIGMRPKWVLSDDERQQKYGSRRKKNKLAAAAAAALEEAHMKDEDENKTEETLSEKFYEFGVEAISEQVKIYKKYDDFLIRKLEDAFYHSREAHKLNFKIIESELKDAQNRKSESTNLRNSILANFIVQPVKRIVTFAKLLPEFRHLTIEDQMALLREGVMELLICSNLTIFDNETNTLKNVIGKDHDLPTDSIQLDILRYIWPNEVFDKTIDYLKSMHKLNIDEKTLILYIPLILFSPHRQGVINKERILTIQNKYSSLLYKYLLFKHNKQVDVTDKIFKNLLLKMMGLPELHALHKSIILPSVETSVFVSQFEGNKIFANVAIHKKNSKIEVYSETDNDVDTDSINSTNNGYEVSSSTSMQS